MKKIKAVVFDLDGTLTHFTIDYMAARREVIEKLILTGVPDSLVTEKLRIMDIIKVAENFFNNTIKTPEKIPTIKTQIDFIITNYEMNGARKTGLIPGAKELLIYFKEKKCKIGLYTLENKKVTNYLLNKFSIGLYFDSIITRDDVRNPKPHPEHLRMVLDQLNVLADEVLVIGDHPIDFECAKQFNALAIGLISDRHTKDELLKSGANYAVSNLLDILEILKQIEIQH
jgi:phosphoglycolate phosphatase-like HAD superfamily hydrolase